MRLFFIPLLLVAICSCRLTKVPEKPLSKSELINLVMKQTNVNLSNSVLCDFTVIDGVVVSDSLLYTYNSNLIESISSLDKNDIGETTWWNNPCEAVIIVTTSNSKRK